MLGKTARKFTKPRPTFRDALNPIQSKIMAAFLRDLSWAGNKAIEAGVKPNIKLFIKAWIGLPISKKEMRLRHRKLQRDYLERKKD